ncbi:DUF1868 domain-containing protein [Anabaena sp. FACHB-1237]|uniref:DUF1868 domain-containing protein n=1 Tax=Anabaena sp. FACHB-1237 TaxID=2692769 RepID=UPI001680DB39|nr:DUF1868 domain-containing protein [Anabaena sp. FACHB-1237]MBD2139144.1 DUF1868 domain-containing protein [Anabaena sp. FACHB-1237]
MDDNYQTYLNRVARMTLPESYKSQVQHIQESSKFQLDGGVRKAANFPGYTMITPPAGEDQVNADFYKQIETYQQELLQLPIPADLIAALPPASFHITLADLIWDSAYIHATQKNPDFAEQLSSCLVERFTTYKQEAPQETQVIIWQVLGLIVMPRAIGICLIPKDQNSYERIMALRRLIYQNRPLMGLGIEQHYHFTAHITLGYFGHIADDLDRNQLSNMFSDFNKSWALKEIPEFLVNRVELRKFDDMTNFYRQENWPSLDF